MQEEDQPKEIQIAPGVYITDYRASSSSPASNPASQSSEVFAEVQISPGIYMIDYRHPTHISPDRLSSSQISQGPLTADQYIQELQRRNLMSEDFLRSEYERIQLSICKLEESNSLLSQESDPECQQAIAENLQVISTSQEKLRRLEQFLPPIPDSNIGNSNGIYL